MNRMRRSFQLEPLEPRALLTVAHPIRSAAAAAIVAAPAIPQPAALEGMFTGGYTAVNLGPHFGLAAGFTGMGTISGLGGFHLRGFVDHPAPTGEANGQLVLTNARGTLVVHLDGPAASGTDRVQGQLHFVIKAGTGAFRGMFGEGIILVNGGAGIPTGRARGALTIQLEPIVATVNGTVIESPIFPSTDGSTPDFRPLAGAVIVVERTDGVPFEVTRVQSDVNGHFTLSLAPGKYLFTALHLANTSSPQPTPPGFVIGDLYPAPPSPEHVSIGPGQVVNLVFNYDTGIR